MGKKTYLDVDLVATCLTHLFEKELIGAPDGELEHLHHVLTAAVRICHEMC